MKSMQHGRNGINRGKIKYLEENLPTDALFTTNTHGQTRNATPEYTVKVSSNFS
jgi:hypothetical protein